MKLLQQKINVVLVFALSVLVLLAVQVPIVSGSDVPGMLKQVNKELRTAERDMFGGKKEKAIAGLEIIQDTLGRIKAVDPDNPKFKQAEKKFQKLVKDLERRTGKDLGGGTLTAKKSSATVLPDKPPVPEMPSVQDKAAVPEKSAPPVEAPVSAAVKDEVAPMGKTPASAKSTKKSDKLPYDARRPFGKATAAMASIDRTMKQFDDPQYRGDKQQLINRLEASVLTVEKKLTEARELAARKGVASHPSFDDLEKKLDPVRQTVAAAKSGHEANVALAAQAAGEIEADVKALKDEYDKLNPILGAATGTVIYYNNIDAAVKLLQQLDNFVKNDQDRVASLVQKFAEKYGSAREDIDGKAQKMGYVGEYYAASFPYLELAKGLENIKKTRTVMAEDLARKSEEMVTQSASGSDFSVVDRLQGAREYLGLAKKYDSTNAVVQSVAGSLDQQIAAQMKVFDKKIVGHKFPKQAGDAPSGAKQLTRAAKKWFEDSRDWGSRETNPYTILKVVITGPWSVQKKNILGEPIMYGLPVDVAVQLQKDKEQNLARVFSLTLRTEELKGVKKEPPFNHATVGSSSFIRPGVL